MTNIKYSNDQTTDIVARSQGFDEGYAAGIKEGISMALAALPEKLVNTKDESDSDYFYGSGNNHAVDQAKSNILKLKKG